MKLKQQNLKTKCLIVFAATLAVNASSCKTQEIKTITPVRIEKFEKSWDGNSNNSGIIDFIDGKGFLVTKKAADRYNALVSIYGKNEIPPVSPVTTPKSFIPKVMISPSKKVNLKSSDKKTKSPIRL